MRRTLLIAVLCLLAAGCLQPVPPGPNGPATPQPVISGKVSAKLLGEKLATVIEASDGKTTQWAYNLCTRSARKGGLDPKQFDPIPKNARLDATSKAEWASKARAMR